MSNDLMRDAFESVGHRDFIKNLWGGYRDPEVLSEWRGFQRGWQAALASQPAAAPSSEPGERTKYLRAVDDLIGRNNEAVAIVCQTLSPLPNGHGKYLSWLRNPVDVPADTKLFVHPPLRDLSDAEIDECLMLAADIHILPGSMLLMPRHIVAFARAILSKAREVKL